MPRRKATENGSASSTPKQRSRKKKEEAPKFDPSAAPGNVFEGGVAMQSHNGHMMMTSPEEGAIPSSMTSPFPPGHPPDYFYQNNPGGPAPSSYIPPGPQHPFMEPEPTKSPFGVPPGLPQIGPGMAAGAPSVQSQAYMLRLRQMGLNQLNAGNPTPPPQLEFRLQEMNRRLFIFKNSVLNEKDHAQWWDAFACEFFDDQARMTFIIFEDLTTTVGQRFTIGRPLIPRYFRTMFEGGVNEMIFLIRTSSRETHNAPMSLTSLDCDNVLLITKHDKNSMCEAQTECKLFAEFSFDDSYGYRVRQWTIEMRPSAEYISRDVLMNAELMEKAKTSICKNGLTNLSLNYLKMCSILEPMQILMFHSKSQNINPKEALKHTLFAEHQKMSQHMQQRQQQMAMNQMNPMNPPMIPVQPEEPPTKAKTTRKRQRKTANTNAGGGGAAAGGAGSKKKTANTASPAPVAPTFGNPIFTLQYQDVMVVGEPSMMGGEYGEEDERTISRVENTQYDPSMQSSMPPPPSSAGGPPNPLGGPPLPHVRSDFNTMI